MNGKMEFACSVRSRKRERKSGIFLKWKRIILRLGTKAVKQSPTIARCCARNTIELNLENNMEMKERYWEATTKAAIEIAKPWYKKAEFWIGIIANVIALGALIVAIIALKK